MLVLLSSTPSRSACDSFAIQGVLPGMTFAQVRKLLGNKWQSWRREPGPLGTETATTYLGDPFSVTIIYDGDPAAASKSRVLRVRLCGSDDAVETNPLEGWAQRWGTPHSGVEHIAVALRNGNTTWYSAECRVELVAFRAESEWWQRTADAVCIEATTRTTAPPRAKDEVIAAVTVETDRPAPVPAGLQVDAKTGAASGDGSVADALPPAPPSATRAYLRHAVDPIFPPGVNLGSAEARVTLEALVTARGTVEVLEVVSVTHPQLGFEAAAKAAIQQWSYEPATQNGRAVDQRIRITVRFH